MLQYSFNIPYAGGFHLTVENTGSDAQSFSTLQFVCNSDLSLGSAPWGTLIQNAKSITKTQDANGNYVHTVTLKSPLQLAPGQSADLNYAVGTLNGPLQIAMDPSVVQVSNDGSTYTPLDIAGKSNNPDPVPGKRVGGYYPNWAMYSSKFNVTDLPVNRMNTVKYAFINFDEKGNVSSFDSNADAQQLPQLSIMRKQYFYLNTALSFGGWTLSKNFSPMASDNAARENFVKQAVAAMREAGCNEINIDWEYPVVNGAPGEPAGETPQDALGYTVLLEDLRKALDAASQEDGASYYLSIAGAGGVDKLQAIEKYLPGALERIARAVNFVDVMAYDYHGAFDASNPPPFNVSDFQAPMALAANDPFNQSPVQKLYTIQTIFQAYLQYGFQPSQLMFGFPAYVRAVTVQNCTGDNKGLYQVVTGAYQGQFDKTGIYTLAKLLDPNNIPGQGLPSTVQFVSADDPLCQAASECIGYDPTTGVFFSFDTADSLQAKLKQINCAGAFIWDLSGDPSTPSQSLIAAIGIFYNAQASQQYKQPVVVESAAPPSQDFWARLFGNCCGAESPASKHSEPPPDLQV